MYAGFWWYHGILVVHLQDSVGAFGAKWLTKWLHHAKAPPHRGMLRWEWGNKDVHLVTTFVFCHVSKCFYFSTRFSLWKRVRKMPKSGTGHADAIGFRGHIHVMHWNNSSLQLGNKMAKLSNIDSYHETLQHIANHGFACSSCAQMIQRILWCCNGFCDFHWNCIQRILCSSGALSLPAGDIRNDLTQTSHWFGQNPGRRNITYKDFFFQFWCLDSWVCL